MNTKLAVFVVLNFAFILNCDADSATWNLNPTNGDWNTAENWTPNTIPNGPADVATFGLSNKTGVTFSANSTEVAEIVFDSAATNPFNITVEAGKTFTMSGFGVVNNSGLTQNLSIGPSLSGAEGYLYFENTATAGTSDVTYTAYGAAAGGSNGSEAVFLGNSTAGSATFVAQGATHGLDVGGGIFSFNDNSTAENARFTINGAQNKGGFGGFVAFGDFATADNATFVINPGMGQDLDAGGMAFRDNATAGKGIFILNATPCCLITATGITFNDSSTGGNGFFMNIGGGVDFIGYTFTGLITSAGDATIINEGGNGVGSIGAATFFYTSSTADHALLVANGGQSGGGPGHTNFDNDSDGGEAQIEVYGSGYLDISFRDVPSVTIGSLAGDGFAYVGSNNLTVGSNNLDTTFSGVIQEDGGSTNGSNGSLTKIGTGTLTLIGANTYTGGTTISKGTLFIKTKPDSGTGSGKVAANTGTLGGTGTIGGAVTIGKGNGTGAFLAPGTNGIGTLTLKDTLTFKLDGTYQFELNSSKVKADKAIAKGVTIRSGAQFSISDRGSAILAPGTTFTAIRNTAATPFSGTFANLPDGSTVTIGSNTFQVSYEGGDGNDLTLTVVP